MATIPTNPSDGDTFTDGAGVTWTYNSSSNKWLIPVATASSGGGSTVGWTSGVAPTVTVQASNGALILTGAANGTYFTYTNNSTSTTIGAIPGIPPLTNTTGNSYIRQIQVDRGAQAGWGGTASGQGFLHSGDTLSASGYTKTYSWDL